MTMKRVALTLALMMLVGTLATPLLSEFHDGMPVILDDKGTDVMTAHGSGNETLDIDHSGHVYEHPNGTKVWDSNTTVNVEFDAENLTVGSGYHLYWLLLYWDNNTWASVQSDNVSFSPAFTSITVAMEAINGLADGTYQFEAYLSNATGHTLDLAVSLVMVGNSSGTSAGNGQVYVDIDHSGYVYEHPNGTEVWASGSDVYVEFTSGNLTVGENYQLIWNLSDSTSNFGHVTGHYDWGVNWNATTTSSVETSTVSGLADGVYYFHATLVNQGSHVATDMTMIQVGNTTGGSNTWVSLANSSSGETSIVLAPGTEAVHIAHRGLGGALYHTTDASGSWVSTAVTSTYINSQLDMTVASNGTLYIAYRHDSGNLSLAWSPDGGSTWSIRGLVTNGSAQGQEIGSDLDTTNHRLTISYQMFGTTLTTIDLDPRFIATDPLSILTVGNTSLNTGRYSDVAVTPMGYWVTAYYHADNAADLRTAGRFGPGLHPNTAWSGDQAVDTSGQTGTYVSVDTDSGDNTFIAFHSGDELKVATYDAGQWVATSVDGDASTNVGLDTSMFIDTSNDFVHVAYRDLTNQDLKYAVRDASGNWNVSTLDSTGLVGFSTSIVVDSNGDCHISYIDHTNSALKYYACSGATSSNSGSGGGSGGGNDDPSECTHLDVLPSTRPHNGGPNQTEWTYGVDIFDAYAHHTCLEAGMYDWNFSLYDANGHMPTFYEDGMFEIHDDDAGSHYDFHVRNFEATDLPVGQYTWWYGISNYTMGISQWANHTFTVVDSTASQSCFELETERLQQYYYAEETAVNTILVDCPAVGEAIEVYWKVTQYQDGTIMDDGWWNTTATSTSMSHTVETDHLPIGVWYAFSATMYTDNGTLYEWHSFNIIPSYNPNPGPDEMCGESNARTSIHVTNDANTNTYMGHEYYSDDDFNHDITLDCLITSSTYEVEYILTHYHTGYLVDAGWWNFTATGPSASITKTWSGLPVQIWYAVTAMYTFDNGVTISSYEKFYVNSTAGPDLLGYCSFPTFEATPATVQSGDDLTFTWTMDGDVTDDVYLALHSGWGAQYYFSSVEDNDGSHTITLPANMNPNEDYTVYIESASNGQRTTVCWKYGSIDVLEDDEGVVLDDIINDFLNTTDERPRISMWYGKVNQHNWNGTWMTDPDGVAGAGLYSQWGSEGWGDRKLEYCQRFWPETVEIRASAAEEIVFYTRGNTDAYLTMKPVWLCVQDTDGDGILDPEDEDDDGDGWPDIFEDVCLSDALDPNVVPEDLDGDGLCDVLQILLVGDFEPPEPGFCTDGEITGGNGLVGQDLYTELVVIEMTGGTYQYQYEIHDWTNGLHEDLQQDASNHDFRGYYEYYDVFLSDADGVFNPNGSFVTVQARSDLSTTNLGVGHNIDAIGIRDANGNVLYASEVVSVVLGDGLGSNNPDGRQSAILGPADQIPTAMGNNQASITVGFCPTLGEESDEPSPGFGAMAALAALGAAMFAGRRGLLNEQDAE